MTLSSGLAVLEDGETINHTAPQDNGKEKILVDLVCCCCCCWRKQGKADPVQPVLLEHSVLDRWLLLAEMPTQVSFQPWTSMWS